MLSLARLTATAATMIVTNTNDNGVGSLRQAILDANAGTGTNTVTFQIPGGGVHTITPSAALPSITEPVVIDGTTQSGFVGAPLIELNGTSAGSRSLGLHLATPNCIIRGLVINRFGAQGLLLQGFFGHVIKGNYIGTDTSGSNARPNGMQGVWIEGSSANLIGGTNAADRNLISGNGDAGVYLQGPGSNN